MDNNTLLLFAGIGALLLLACFVPAVAGCAALLGWWLANRERALQVVLFTSIPLAFVGGFTWPVEALPELLQWLRWLLPSTSGVQASMRLNQLGAPLADAAPYLCALGALTTAALASITLLAGPRNAAAATAASSSM